MGHKVEMITTYREPYAKIKNGLKLKKMASLYIGYHLSIQII
jgi:hypothetical protein